MPELPEVEVTRRGIAPYLDGQAVRDIVVRHSGLRWPFPPDLASQLRGRTIRITERRGKYLLLRFDHGVLLVHLGMSGHLRMLSGDVPAQKHDHFDMVLESHVMRLTDPRRFGAVLWHASGDGPLENHPLLRSLGVEPFGSEFSADLLYRATRTRKSAIKQVLLAGDIVVGVGNIYASESLFEAGIHPSTPACRISRARYERLVDAVKRVLAAAIEKGGSTLRDFIGADGQSGYFQQHYFVYDRTGLPCRACGSPVRQIRHGQRSTFYCVNCQK